MRDRNPKKAIEQCRSNFEYFKNNFDALHEKYARLNLVIEDCNVVADFVTFDEANEAGTQRFGLGGFSIQYCSREEFDESIYHTV